MTKAKQLVSTNASVRKSPRRKGRPLKLSPLGRKLYAAAYEHALLARLDPEAEVVSAEVARDERYKRAHAAAWKRAWERQQQLADEVLSKPVTFPSLADRALVALIAFGDRSCGEAGLPTSAAMVDAVLSLSGQALDLPWTWAAEGGWYDGNPPPEAEARLRQLLGRHRPKRSALPSDEADRIAAEAVAKAEAAIKAQPGPAPLFAEAA